MIIASSTPILIPTDKYNANDHLSMSVFLICYLFCTLIVAPYFCAKIRCYVYNNLSYPIARGFMSCQQIELVDVFALWHLHTLRRLRQLTELVGCALPRLVVIHADQDAGCGDELRIPTRVDPLVRHAANGGGVDQSITRLLCDQRIEFAFGEQHRQAWLKSVGEVQTAAPIFVNKKTTLLRMVQDYWRPLAKLRADHNYVLKPSVSLFSPSLPGFIIPAGSMASLTRSSTIALEARSSRR